MHFDSSSSKQRLHAVLPSAEQIPSLSMLLRFQAHFLPQNVAVGFTGLSL